MRSEEDQNLYYVIVNGVLMKKTQAYAANKALQQRPGLPKDATSFPGPGSYSPNADPLQAGFDPNARSPNGALKHVISTTFKEPTFERKPTVGRNTFRTESDFTTVS